MVWSNLALLQSNAAKMRVATAGVCCRSPALERRRAHVRPQAVNHEVVPVIKREPLKTLLRCHCKKAG